MSWGSEFTRSLMEAWGASTVRRGGKLQTERLTLLRQTIYSVHPDPSIQD